MNGIKQKQEESYKKRAFAESSTLNGDNVQLSIHINFLKMFQIERPYLTIRRHRDHWYPNDLLSKIAKKNNKLPPQNKFKNNNLVLSI